ncbi:MAG: hypothetical protein QOC77_2792 [Thermoleophilaceae bacterium]|jgi:hypothetical protein|nr:hypothetical protein [Thermoleophilaceae bacterium]
MNVFTRAVAAAAQAADHRFGWDKMPRPLGLLTLAGIRFKLRDENLFDTETNPPQPPPAHQNGAGDPHIARTLDGSYNDLDHPMMGAVGCRFGRNIPLDQTFPEPEPDLLDPSPRTVSLELLTRKEFIPATTLNVLAAAWLQFEVHDWLWHGKPQDEKPFSIPLADGDPWPEHPMQIQRTLQDPTPRPPGCAPTYRTAESHWWDGSQIYGNNQQMADSLRTREDGKLRLDDDLIPHDVEAGLDLSDVAGAGWIGLYLLHIVFMKEHNAICDRLRSEYPGWSDDQIYHRARLVNGALMAKIHTVEWTPAIIAHPTTQHAMHAQWYGLISTKAKRLRDLPFAARSELLTGIPGTPTDHHGTPYSLTEEFVAVYRMHPLLPDEYAFRTATGDELLQEREFPEVGALQCRARLEEMGVGNALYSLGIANPGAITLHNFPRHLQHFDRPDGRLMDLAATDIVRIRARGVPRYNTFRKLFHLKPAKSFADLTDNPEWAEEMSRVYGGDIDRLDLMPGLYAEPVPRGFGFSDTAFRVFILMASRRLKSDRFFTRDYTPQMYTQTGLDWIEENSMKSVLLRHFPELGASLGNVENAFEPWPRVAAPRRPATAQGQQPAKL